MEIVLPVSIVDVIAFSVVVVVDIAIWNSSIVV